MKSLEIISVVFDVINRLLISYSTPVRYWRRNDRISAIYRLQEAYDSLMREVFLTYALISVLNIAAEWLTLPLHIWEVQGSNLGIQTSYPDYAFSWFPHSFPSTVGT
jgi:hypothetical protein